MAFWTSGSASPIRSARIGRAWAATSGSRPRAAVDVGDGRDRGADEAALPARRRVDQLLELRPAIGFGQDAAARDVGQRVHRDPVARAGGLDPQALPGALGLAHDRPLEEVVGEPVHLQDLVAEQGVGDVEEGRRPVLAHRLTKPRLTASSSGCRTPSVGPRPGAIQCMPSWYSGSARRSRPVWTVVASTTGSLTRSPASRPSARAAGVRSETRRAGALRRRRDGRGIRCGRGHPASTSSGVSPRALPASAASSGTTRNAYRALSSSFRDSGAAT